MALRSALLLCTALSFTLVPLPAQAGDGILEINQACAAVGCFEGDGPGIPVEIRSAGSYRLTSNLVSPAGGSAIQILADGVVLDLGGFTVAYCLDPPVGVVCVLLFQGDGIDGTGFNDVTVRNGLVKGFPGRGVTLGRRAHVERLGVVNNGGGGILVLQNSLVESNRIAFNDGLGASLGAGTAWGNNVLTTNDPDVSGSAVAVTNNLCSGVRCGRVKGRHFFLTSNAVPERFKSCPTGFRVATPMDLEDPSSLEYIDGPGFDLNDIALGGSGWVFVSVALCGRAFWDASVGDWQTVLISPCEGDQVTRSTWCVEK